MDQPASSPSATGPAGAHIEAKIAASYLLAMLLDADGRAIPGVRIERVKLQRGAEGHPLDDVIITGRDQAGHLVGMDVQAKRSITFAPGDAVFQKVLGQICETLQRPDDAEAPASLAIATSQTSRKISGPYQDVLTWARQIQEPQIFADRLKRPGSANDDMRAFVATVRSGLAQASLASDDEAVWRLLRRMHILVFDFSTADSASQALALEQCVRALDPDQIDQAPALWSALTDLALEVASAGGDLDRTGVVSFLQARGLRLAGLRRHAQSRAILEEGARHALADIDDRVADQMLLRPQRVDQIRQSMDSGRYVEIRGAGGVGKSALLKHFAAQISEASRVIVLTPERTPAGGWMALRDQLGFTGTARELLVDLAVTGGGMLLIDGLDNFRPPALKTVRDLVREAADAPGFSVLVTLRLDADQTDYLPTDILDRLGRAPPVVIAELDADEVGELRHAAPGVAALLSDTHPARNVARNLYRLKRLLRVQDPAAIRTEVDLAEQWWTSGDGEADGRRERLRLLATLADQVLAGNGQLDTSSAAAATIDALIYAGALRDLGSDRAVFAHDVLREWAVFNRLREGSARLDLLPLVRTAPPAFARGVELLARHALEREENPAAWIALVERLSSSANGSWRRSALVALVRSELGEALLDKAEPYLLGDGGKRLDELIRTLMAVEVQPAEEFLAALGIPQERNHAAFSIPRGPAWVRLVAWILKLETRLPTAVMPSVVGLYTHWLRATWGYDRTSRAVLGQLFAWLDEIEDARDGPYAMRRAPFGADFNRDQIDGLESTLRIHAAGFARARPDLAAAYIAKLASGEQNRQAIQEVLTFPGTLAHAAPTALADLTATALIEVEPSSRRAGRHRRPFTFLDNQFLPESPARGPFLGLLQAEPATGLALLRRLIDHAMAFYQHDPEDEAIPIGDGVEPRMIAWPETYSISRPGSAVGHALTCGLMALEAWGHQRIEKGDAVSVVVGEILGASPIPAPFVLVAVDLILSHWSDDAADAAIDLAGAPELLCRDRERHTRDNMSSGPDFLAYFGVMQKEPGQGDLTAAALKARPSRRVSLEQIFGTYAFGPAERMGRLRARLEAAAQRLGPVTEDMTFAAPAFMAAHALHAINKAHYEWIPLPEHGTKAGAWAYVPSAEEDAHLKALMGGKPLPDVGLQMALSEAVADPQKVTGALLARAAGVLEGAAKDDGEPMDREMDRIRRLSAALLVARHAVEADWPRLADGVEAAAQAGLEMLGDRENHGQHWLQYDPAAMGFVALVYARFRDRTRDLRPLLAAIAAPSGAAVRGVREASGLLSAIHPGLEPSILRLGLARCIWRARPWDETDEATEERRNRDREAANERVEAELAWLGGRGEEPPWPVFPLAAEALAEAETLTAALAVGVEDEDSMWRQPGVREAGVDLESAGRWLEIAFSRSPDEPWRLALLDHYGPWTVSELVSDEDEDDDDVRASRWSRAFFSALGRIAASLSEEKRKSAILDVLPRLGDDALLTLAPEFLRSLDDAYFNGAGFDGDLALSLRQAVAHEVQRTRPWVRMAKRWSSSIEMNLGPAVAALFFNGKGFSEPPKTYLLEPAMDRIAPFLAFLADTASAGASLIAAQALLSTLEVAPRAGFAIPLLSVAESWMETFPAHVEFWSEQGVGRRVATLLESLQDLDDPAFQSERVRIEALLVALVALGVPQATRLENRLAERSGP